MAAHPLVDEAMKKAAVAWVSVVGDSIGGDSIGGDSVVGHGLRASRGRQAGQEERDLRRRPVGGPALALWCLPLAGSLYVVSAREAAAGADSGSLPPPGSEHHRDRRGEQSAPGLATATRAWVTLRGDHGGRIVTWLAATSRVEPGTEEWARVVPQLAAKRLNAPGTAEALAARWAAECVVTRLTPVDEPVDGRDAKAGGGITAGSSLPTGSLAEAPRPTPAARSTRKPFRLHRVRSRQ